MYKNKIHNYFNLNESIQRGDNMNTFKGFIIDKKLNTLVCDLHDIHEKLATGEQITGILYRGVENDFSIDLNISEYRFISSEVIDEIQCEELSCDEYALGCFNAGFLAGLDNMPLDYDALVSLQQTGAYAAIGKIILGIYGLLKELQSEYSKIDGYGHYFAGYDGEEHEVVIGEDTYYVFRTN